MENATEIQKLYASIPASVCKTGCADCCYDIIQAAPEERERMGGYEWDGKCVHLKGNRCAVHENRPLVCRLLGVSEIMPCGDCTPGGILSADETKRIVEAYVKIKNEQELGK